jgi:hypothetical protein
VTAPSNPEELEIEYEAPPYPDWADEDEQRRAFVLECLGSADIDGRILLDNCALLAAWLKDGTVPPKDPGNIRRVK